MGTPEILYMLISELPVMLMDRRNRKVKNIRRELRESDLTDFIQFVEEETLLMNDPVFEGGTSRVCRTKGKGKKCKAKEIEELLHKVRRKSHPKSVLSESKEEMCFL